MPGPQELVIILIVVLVLFGGTKIPQIMKGFGQGLKEFKKAKTDIETDITKPELKDSKDSKDSKDTEDNKS